MSTKKVTIQVTGSGILQDDVIMLGEGVLKALKIPSGRPLQLQFGSFRREVTVIPVPRYDGLPFSRYRPLMRMTAVFVLGMIAGCVVYNGVFHLSYNALWLNNQAWLSLPATHIHHRPLPVQDRDHPGEVLHHIRFVPNAHHAHELDLP